MKSKVTQEDILSCIDKETYNLGEWYEQTKGMVIGKTNKRLYRDFIESAETYRKENRETVANTAYH